MDTLSFSSSHSHMDIGVSMLMDTSQDFESSQGGVVQWVASQSTNPALQALMKEAERDRRTRSSTPVHEPASWTYPLSSTTSSASLSASVSSAWHSSDHNPVDTSRQLPLSGSSSSASSSSLAPRATDPSASRRAKPPSSAQRKPPASSTSSASQPTRHSTRPRSSSHSKALPSQTIRMEKYNPRDDEPEALNFIELLKTTSRTVDENSIKKQRVARAKEKEGREQSLPVGRSGIDNCTGLGTHNLSTRPLTKTSSASAIFHVKSSTKAPEKPPSTSMPAHEPEPRGRTLVKGPSMGTGKSTPNSLSNPNLKRDPKHASTPQPPTVASNVPSTNHSLTRKTGIPEPISNDGDSMMQDVIDLTESDTEWEKPVSNPISRADTTMCMDLDDEDSDAEMDTSFFKPEPPPRSRIAEPKLKPQPPPPPTRPLGPTQRARAGPPPLGMRRAPQFQPSQYSSTQGSKSVTVPRFKPPLLASVAGTTNKGVNGTRPATTTRSKPSPRGVAAVTKVPVVETTARPGQDADSSFDVSFGVDADALEEVMKVYD